MVICSFCQRLNVFRPILLKSPIRHPETSKSDGMQRQIWLSAPFCRRHNVFRPRLLKSPLHHPETSKFDGMQRQIWSSAPFVEDSMSIDRDYFSLPLLSGDNKVRWLAETNMVICSLCRRLNVYRPRLLLSPFAIQRQSSLMACRDKYGHLLLFGDLNVFRPRLLQSPFLHPETTMSNGMRRPS